MTDMVVAQTILQQLGGNKFIAMTGAKNLSGGKNMLSMKIPNMSNKASHLRITLTAMDDYLLEFFKIVDFEPIIIDRAEGVYAENLRAVFTDKTGLYTSL